ncbi:MAG: hypothetical protein ACYS8K_02050 [Planctomycetota bacterium]
MRAVLNYLWRVILATVLLLGVSVLSFRLIRDLADYPEVAVGPWEMLGWFCLSQFLIVAVLAYPILRSRWSGTQLTCVVFVVYFGVRTFVGLAQAVLVAPGLISIHTAAFMSAHGFLVAVVSSFLIVLIMGRLKQQAPVSESSRLHLPAGEWLWKLAVCLLFGTALYLMGQLILWPRLGDFYQRFGLAPLGERLILEVGRSLLLVAFVLPVVKMMKGGRREAAITVALVLCVLGGVAPMLIPSALLPDDVRLVQLSEMGASNFLYGLLVGYLFSRQPGAM